MKITPLDIEKHEFGVRLRGYDPDEVRSFLRLVSEAYELVVREARDLREQRAHLQEDLSAYRERERILKDTLLNAQKMSDEMHERAEKDADMLLREAEIKSDRIISRAQIRATKIENSISELKILKGQLRLKIRNSIELVENVLRVQDEEDAADEAGRYPGESEDSASDGLLDG